MFKAHRRVGGTIVESRFWYGAIQMPGDAREKRWCLYTTDKREADRLLQDERIRREKEASGVLPPRPQQEAAQRPLVDLLGLYLVAKRANCTPTTLKKYGHIRVLFERVGWGRIGDVTGDSFEAWRENSGLAPRTLNALQKDTGAFFRWLCGRRMAARNPLQGVTPIPTKRLDKYRRAMTEDEERRFLAAVSALARREELNAPGGPRVVRLTRVRAVLYLLVLKTGLRRNEVQQLVVGDFELDTPAPFLRVRACLSKNAKEAVLWLVPEVVEGLRLILPDNAMAFERLFAGAVPRIPRFKLDLMAAGIPFEDSFGRRIDFHALRHTFGTRLAAQGVAPFVLKELMRHSTIQQTEKYYVDATQLPLAAALAKLPKSSVDVGEVRCEERAAT